jgi:hypothetical protein
LRRRRGQQELIWIVLIIVITILVFFSIRNLATSPEQSAFDMVNQFYQEEQAGNFSASWSLFHSSMQAKFPKGHYIQDRAHVFMNHFGVETFTYKLSKPEKLKKWKLSSETPAFTSIYKITVTQTYKGKYGNFNITQDTFAIKEKGEWKLAWDYNQ